MKRNIYEGVDSNKDNYLQIDADDAEKAKLSKPQVATKSVLEKRKIAHPYRRTGGRVKNENGSRAFDGLSGAQNPASMPGKAGLGGTLGSGSLSGDSGAKGVSSFAGLPQSTMTTGGQGINFNFGMPSDYAPGRATQQPADRLKLDNEAYNAPGRENNAQPTKNFSTKRDFAGDPPNQWLAAYVEKMTALNHDYIEYVQKWVTKYQYVDLSPGTEAYMTSKKRITEEARKQSSQFSSSTSLSFEPTSSPTMYEGTAHATTTNQPETPSALILKGGVTSRKSSTTLVSGASSATNVKAVPLSSLPGGTSFSSASKNDSAVFRPSPLGQSNTAPRPVSPSLGCEHKSAPNDDSGKSEHSTELPNVPTFGSATNFGKAFGSASTAASDMLENNAPVGPLGNAPKAPGTPFFFGKPHPNASSSFPTATTIGFKELGEKSADTAKEISPSSTTQPSASMNGLEADNVGLAEPSSIPSTKVTTPGFKMFGTNAGTMTKTSSEPSDGIADIKSKSGSNTEHTAKKPWNPTGVTVTPMFTSFGFDSGSGAETSSTSGTAAASMFGKPMPKLGGATNTFSDQKGTMSTGGFNGFASNPSPADSFSGKKTDSASSTVFGSTGRSTVDTGAAHQPDMFTGQPKRSQANDISKSTTSGGSDAAATIKTTGFDTSTSSKSESISKTSTTPVTPGFTGFKFGAGPGANPAMSAAAPMTFKGFGTRGDSAIGTSMPKTNVSSSGFNGFGMTVSATSDSSSGPTASATPGFKGFGVGSASSAESTTPFKFGLSAKAQPVAAMPAFPKFQMFSKLGQQTEQSSSAMSSRSSTGQEEALHGNRFSSLVTQEGRESTAADADDVEEAGPEAETVQEDSRDVVGEEDEENIVSTRSKLYELKKEKEGFKWREMGIGNLRINKYIQGPNVGRHRVLLRPDSAAGQLVLNSFVEESFKPSKVGKSSLTINVLFASPDGPAELKKILIKVRDAEELVMVDNALAQALGKDK